MLRKAKLLSSLNYSSSSCTKPRLLTSHNYFSFSNDLKGFRFCIIGGGPAGMHTAKQILKDIPNSYVDLYEKMPFPFGLIRTGVAPDHQDVKKILREFSKIAEESRFNFYGNVEIGRDIDFEKLRSMYSATVLTYGAESDKKLGLPGENELKGIYAARSIVNWYNSHPEHNYLDDKLGKEHDVKNIVIIGNGNVAVDVARIFARKVSELANTDINNKTLELRKNYPVENIHMVARRGCIQAAFTTKSLRELVNLEDVEKYAVKEEIEDSLNDTSLLEADPIRTLDIKARANKRKFDVFRSVPIVTEKELHQIMNIKPKTPRLIFRFLLTPTKLNGENGKLKSVEFAKNILKGELFNQESIIDESLGKTEIKCDLLLRSIGYKSLPIGNVNFDPRTSTIPSSNGCVLAKHDPTKIEVGLYVSGWIKTGPVGVIDTTLRDSIETFINIKQHFLKGYFVPKIDPRPEIENILKQNNVKTYNYEDWKKADIFEIEEGKKVDKIREKIKTREEYAKIVSL